jgi:hypothetical protein
MPLITVIIPVIIPVSRGASNYQGLGEDISIEFVVVMD